MDSGGLVNDFIVTNLSKHITQEENHIMSQSNIMDSSGQKSQQWWEAVELQEWQLRQWWYLHLFFQPYIAACHQRHASFNQL